MTIYPALMLSNDLSLTLMILCLIQSDARACDNSYLGNSDFTQYRYSKSATDMVDSMLAVQTSPASADKFKNQQGAKATKKLEQLESIGHELN